MTLNLAAHDNAKFGGGSLQTVKKCKIQKKKKETPQKGKFKLD